MEDGLGKRYHGEKGKRWVGIDGYVFVSIPKSHHLANNGIRHVHEHRLVAEEKYGRRLKRGEIVHHIDEDRKNNHPDNILLCANIAEHMVHHRKKDKTRRMPVEPNPTIQCFCGCGKTMRKYHKNGKVRKYIHGHTSRGTPVQDIVAGMLSGRVLTRNELSSLSGLDKNSVQSALKGLRERGLVRNMRPRRWILAKDDINYKYSSNSYLKFRKIRIVRNVSIVDVSKNAGVWDIYLDTTGDKIGVIQWNKGLREYCLEAIYGYKFSSGHLHYIGNLMEALK